VEQSEAKAARVREAFAPFAVLAGAPLQPVREAEPRVSYRTRAKLAVEGARVGLYARGTHDVLDLPQCRVLAPVVFAAVAAVRRLLNSQAAALRLRAIDVREIVDERGAGALLTLVVAAPGPPRERLEAICAALVDALPSLRAIALSLHDGRSPQLLGAAPEIVRGDALHRDLVREGAPWIYAAPGSFAQAHRAQAAAIHADVESALAPHVGRRVLDVFAGSGALGLALAARGAEVTLVESFEPALRAAERAAHEQGIAVRTRSGRAETVLPALRAEHARFDAAVANPPRRGLAPRLREALAAIARDAIAYVSCEPATLARDLAHFAWLGWQAERVAPFDLMPQTGEVECVAVLRRAAPPELVALFEDDQLLAVDKPPFLATVPHPERKGSLLARVRARAGASGAAPLHRLDADTSGVCLFAKRVEHVAAWQRALADAGARKRYLALARGVGRAKGRIARPLREAGRTLEAATRYRRVEVVGGHALLEVVLESGRTHQIRRHLASIGEPVVGDARFGHTASNRHAFERHLLDRAFLHCASIELAHPASGAPLRIESPLAPDLAAALARMRG
jgi:23S rRNA (uracil1939-C5)-methyltransferase